MAIMTEICTVEIRANGSVTVPEGNWKVIGATGIADAAGAGGVTSPACKITVAGDDCVEDFFDAAAGGTIANNFADKSVFYAEHIDPDHATVSAGAEIAAVCGTAWDTNQSVFQVTLKRT